MANQSDPLSDLLHALSDPTRRSMLAQLSREPMAITRLAEPTGLRLPTIMRHVAVMEQSGLITTHKHGRERICTANPDALAPAQQWMADQRAAYDAQLARLDAFVTANLKESDENHEGE